MVTVVREAEAAAFYHLRQSIVFSGGRHQERPLDREYRSLIIDVGAGTADYALIASRNIAGSSGEVKILGHTYCTWAGNRFDEVLLKEVFGHKDSVGALARDRRLRDDTRRFKERELNDLFQSADGATPTLGGKPAVIGFASDRQFLAAMDGYYAQAFDRPLRDLRELLGAENWIDEVVLAGRGVFAYGCFGRIEEQVLQNFRPHPSSARISIGHIGKENAEESIGRGALTFVRHGYIRGSHSDLSAVRDVALIADIDGHRAWKAIQHAGGALQTGRRSFRFPGEILGAWVVCGLPLLREAERNRCFDDLRNGKPLGPHEALLASWRPTALTQALTVELSGDEQAEFVGN